MNKAKQLPPPQTKKREGERECLIRSSTVNRWMRGQKNETKIDRAKIRDYVLRFVLKRKET